jgi:hypothetical protein
LGVGVGVGDEGEYEDPPHAVSEITIATPLSIASAVATLNSRRPIVFCSSIPSSINRIYG